MAARYSVNISRPVADHKSNLKPFVNLRELATRAFLGAEVKRGSFGQGEPIPECIRCCTSNISKRAVRAMSGGEGHIHFQPLPVGE